MKIRIATIDDIAAIDRLVLANYPLLLAAHYDAALLKEVIPLMARTSASLVSGQTYFVAESGGKIVGGVGWTSSPPGAEPAVEGCGHIRKLVMDARYLRRGIARSLMARVHENAAAAGVSQLGVLSTRNATPFYASVGYGSSMPTSVPIGSAGTAFPAVKMIRKI